VLNKKSFHMKQLYTYLILLIVHFGVAQTTLLQEFFEYEAGDLISNHGWTAHSGIGTNSIMTSDRPLLFSNYIGQNKGNAALVINTGSDENRPLSQSVREPIDGGTSADTYVSFLVKPFDEIPIPSGTTAPYFLHLAQYSDVENPDFTRVSTEFRARVFIFPGSTEGTFRLSLTFNENVPLEDSYTQDLDGSKAHLVVLKYSSNPGPDNDEVSLFVFDENDDISAEPSQPTIGPLKGSRRDIILQAVCLRQYTANQNVIVDGILVRDFWDLTGNTSTKDNITTHFDLKLYPNPVLNSSIISFDTDLALPFNGVIYDMFGNVVESKILFDNFIDISNLSKGVYFLKIQNNRHQVSRKFVIFE